MYIINCITHSITAATVAPRAKHRLREAEKRKQRKNKFEPVSTRSTCERTRSAIVGRVYIGGNVVYDVACLDNVKDRKEKHLRKPKKPKTVKHDPTIPTLDLGTERMVTPPAGQPKARSARVYRVNPKLAAKASELTAPQTLTIYQTLADNPQGLTAEQIEQKVAKLGFKSKNPKSVIGACLYDLRKGVASCKIANLVEIVKPEAAPTEKKPKSAKPKAEPAPAQTPAA